MFQPSLFRITLIIAAMSLLLIVSPEAFASKEKFVRDKPHITAAEEDEKDVVDESAPTRSAKRDAKRRAKEVAEPRSSEDDVDEKTKKKDAARSKKPDD